MKPYIYIHLHSFWFVELIRNGIFAINVYLELLFLYIFVKSYYLTPWLSPYILHTYTGRSLWKCRISHCTKLHVKQNKITLCNILYTVKATFIQTRRKVVCVLELSRAEQNSDDWLCLLPIHTISIAVKTWQTSRKVPTVYLEFCEHHDEGSFWNFETLFWLA